MAGTIRAVGVGVRLDPPALVIDYTETTRGRNRRRVIPLRHLENATSTSVLESLRKGHHAMYIDSVGRPQVLDVLQALLDAVNRVKDGNLNVLDDHTLAEKKREMDKEFERNRIDKSSAAFQYDVQKEFGPPKEESGWDDESEDSEW
eukprot:m.123924 g.123924  ORF g.123924 m.123924 type:complete len:147 (-) comp15581_c0_seq3:197-637(-)